MLKIDCLTGSEENLSTLEGFGNLVNFSRIKFLLSSIYLNFDSLTALGAVVNKDYCNVYVTACWSVLITLLVWDVFTEFAQGNNSKTLYKQKGDNKEKQIFKENLIVLIVGKYKNNNNRFYKSHKSKSLKVLFLQLRQFVDNNTKP